MCVCVSVCECDQFTSLEAVMEKGAQEVADFAVAFSLLRRAVCYFSSFRRQPCGRTVCLDRISGPFFLLCVRGFWTRKREIRRAENPTVVLLLLLSCCGLCRKSFSGKKFAFRLFATILPHPSGPQKEKFLVGSWFLFLSSFPLFFFCFTYTLPPTRIPAIFRGLWHAICRHFCIEFSQPFLFSYSWWITKQLLKNRLSYCCCCYIDNSLGEM